LTPEINFNGISDTSLTRTPYAVLGAALEPILECIKQCLISGSLSTVRWGRLNRGWDLTAISHILLKLLRTSITAA
jgi:hypothetical protein